jgi:uncharacterized protein
MKNIAAIALLLLAPVAAAQAPVSPKPETGSTASVVPSAAAAGASEPARSNPAISQEPAAKPAPKIEAQKEALIRKLFEIQGTRKAMQEVVAGISANMKPTLAGSLPPGDYRDKLIDLFFERFQSRLRVDDLIEVCVPVYDKYFSKEDLAGLVEFYQTPLGQKMNLVLPKVLIETQSAAAGIGEQLGRRSMMEVLAEHPDLAKSLEDASAAKN